MGIFFDFFNDNDIFSKATEADDITVQARNDSTKAIGKQSLPGKPASMNNARDIDPDSADDILGTKNKQSSSDTDPAQPDDSASDDDADNTDDDQSDDSDPDSADDDGSDTDDANPDDTGSDGTDDTTSDDTQSPEETQKRYSLYTNMSLFYNIISSNLDIMYSTPVESEENAKIIQSVITNLTDCKDILYNILCNEFKNSSYVKLQQKYIALKQVYDLCIKLLDDHVSHMELISEKTDKKTVSAKKDDPQDQQNK